MNPIYSYNKAYSFSSSFMQSNFSIAQKLPFYPFVLDKKQKELKDNLITHLTDYQKLIKHLDTDYKNVIQRPNLDAEELKVKIQELCQALEEQNWQASIFNDPIIYAYCGLKAVEKNLLTVNQFGTLMEFFEINKHHQKSEIQSIPLFIDGKINPRAFSLIQETMRSPFNNSLNIDHCYMTQAQTNAFFDKMKTRPRSEQQLFVIPNLHNKKAEIFHFQLERSVAQEIKMSAGINLFATVDSENKRLIPSVDMMQTFLEVTTPYPVRITPTIGSSSKTEIRKNSLLGTRDMALPYPGIDLPNKADTCDSFLGYDFIFHNFYHAFMASLVPLNHCKAAILIGDIVTNLKQNPQFSAFKDFIQLYIDQINDIEIGAYRLELKQNFQVESEVESFWLGFTQTIEGAMLKFLKTKILNLDPSLINQAFQIFQGKVAGEYALLLGQFENKQFIEQIFKKIQEHATTFNTYQINLQSLIDYVEKTRFQLQNDCLILNQQDPASKIDVEQELKLYNETSLLGRGAKIISSN